MRRLGQRPSGLQHAIRQRLGHLFGRVRPGVIQSGRKASPSAPTRLETTGSPDASASRIFNRDPPPIRSGTAITALAARCGRTSGTSA